MAKEPKQPAGSKLPSRIISIEVQPPLPTMERWSVTVRYYDASGHPRVARAHGVSYADACYNLQVRTDGDVVLQSLAWEGVDEGDE